MKDDNCHEGRWNGRVGGLATPPNAVAIQQADATKLVGWILALDTPKK
jgi:cytochrome c